MKKLVSLVLTSLALATSFFTLGCEDSSGTKSPTVDVTGTWHVSADDGGALIVQLVQTGASVTGSMTTAGGSSGSCSGSVSGDELSLRIVSGGDNTDARMKVDGNRGSGTFKDSDGSRGTFLAIRR